jgi:hypothetical protein
MSHAPNKRANFHKPNGPFDRLNPRHWQDSPRGCGLARIEYAITDDLADRAPVLPGFVDDGIFWALVARLPGWPVSERRTLEEKWLGEYGGFLRLSAAEPLVVIPWHVWARILGEVRR